MRVWVEEDKAIVQCDFSEKEFVKAIGDYKFDKARKVWIFPVRKLVPIINQLKIQYSQETEVVYNALLEKQRAYHQQINKANEIKNANNKLGFHLWNYEHLLNFDKLMAHQKKAFELGKLFGSYAFFMETGTGKTLTAIMLMQHLKVPSMVIAPLSTLENVWKKEIEKWSNLRCVVLWNKLKEFKPGYDVYLINYEQFKKLDADTKGKIHHLIEAIVVDESQKLKNNTSAITKVILSYNQKIKHRFCLTGTPAPNNLMEYWGQMAFVNPDLLGENFYKFRNDFFVSVGYGGFQYVPAKGAKEAIIEVVSRQAFSIKKEDCFDLPERTFEERAVYMDELQEKAYDVMLRDNIIQFQDCAAVGVNELAKLMKLRQITAGFVINDKESVVNISRTKIDELLELLEEIPEERQIIIWCQFHFEINELLKVLKSVSPFYGEMTEKEKKESLDNWMNKKTRILLGHPKSGGVGLNLQQCSYMIWFSLSYSQEEFSQACDRIYRRGQENKCTYFLLMAKRKEYKSKKDATVDEIIYDVVVKKQDLMQACMEMLKK